MATMCLEHISQATLDLDFNKKKKDNTNWLYHLTTPKFLRCDYGFV